MFYQETLIFTSNGHDNYRIPSIIATADGTVLAFCSNRQDSLADHADQISLVLCRKTRGAGWGEVTPLLERNGWACNIGSAVYDDETDTAFVFAARSALACPEFGKISPEELADLRRRAQEKAAAEGICTGPVKLASKDHGMTWSESPLRVIPTTYTHYDGRVLQTGGSTHGSAHGIRLRHGAHKGRLLCPSRFGVDRYTDLEGLRYNTYNNAIYSDDHGETWRSSQPVQLGTGEGTLIERADGTILYNSRAYFRDGKRYLATSSDGGAGYGDFTTDDFLIEESRMGCNASFLRVERDDLRDTSRLPADADGLTVFCNPRAATRDNMSACVSFDSGKTWSHVKPIFAGHAAYSSLCFSPADQHFYLLFEKGEKNCYSDGIAVCEFDVEWLMSE